MYGSISLSFYDLCYYRRPVSTPNDGSVENHPMCTQIDTRIRTEEEEKYSRHAWFGLRLVRHCDTSCAVQGRDLRPSAVVVSFVGGNYETRPPLRQRNEVVLLVDEKPRRSTALRPSRMIQPPHNHPCLMARSNTLRELYFDCMLSEGACPTVHRSTDNPSVVHPKLPRRLACCPYINGNCVLKEFRVTSPVRPSLSPR